MRIALLFALGLALFASAADQSVSVYYRGPNSVVIKYGVLDPTATAWGTLGLNRYTTGWAKLRINTNGDAADKAQLYAAGYLEGHADAEGIWDVYQNFIFRMLNGKDPAPELIAYMERQYQWTWEMIYKHAATDPMWAQVEAVMYQLNGLVDGYRDRALPGKPLTLLEFWLFNSSGDLYDLIPALVPSERLSWRTMNASQFELEHMLRSSCSALIKLTGDNIYAGHTTWTDYGSMVRTYKQTYFPLNVPGAKSMSFSAKPSLIYSKDDFYVLDSGLLVMETTNGVRDESLYALITHESLLTWQRLPVCHRLATTGPQWVQCVNRYQSGTYGNQWMILDLKKFTPGGRILPDTLWIVEQVPGYTAEHDVSSTLAAGAWPSYNIPYDSFIYNISGFYDAYQRFGDDYSHKNCPRAKIFQRDMGKVKDLSGMQHILQYNDWKSDPLSLGSPKNAISSRYDIDPTGPAFGGIDSKISSAKDAAAMRAFGISGPSQQQEVFTWKQARYAHVPHHGEPDVWNFAWQTFEW